MNDHVLKQRFPGWWTGKLSDLAGVFVVAVVVALALGRPRAGAAVTAISFAALKLLPMGPVLAAPVLGGLVRRDPSDLLALVALWPAVRFVERFTPGVAEAAFATQLLAVAAGAAMVVTVSATSCLPPEEIKGLAVDGADVYARIPTEVYDGTADDEGHVVDHWAVSHDGGHRWRRASRPATTAAPTCAPDVGCFRVRGQRVEQQRVGSSAWRTSFAFTPAERSNMRARTQQPCDARVGTWGPVALVDRPGGSEVVVAMGSQGVLRRTASGRWERRAVLDLTPVSAAPVDRYEAVVWLPMAGLLGALLALVAAFSRRRFGLGIAMGSTMAAGSLIALAVSRLSNDLTLGSAAAVVGITVAVFASTVLLAVRWG